MDQQHLPNDLKYEFMNLFVEYAMKSLENEDAQEYAELYKKFEDFKNKLSRTQVKAA